MKALMLIILFIIFICHNYSLAAPEDKESSIRSALSKELRGAVKKDKEIALDCWESPRETCPPEVITQGDPQRATKPLKKPLEPTETAEFI